MSEKAIRANPEQFMEQFLSHQRQLYHYLLTLVPRRQDAEDLLQETSKTLWEKFHEYESGSNFFAWGAKVAHLKVLNFRRLQRHRDQILDPDVFDLLADEGADEAEHYHAAQKEALDNCLKKLRQWDRELIQARYSQIGSGELAQQLGRPASSISNSLSRIRATLFECVRRQVDVAHRTPHL